MIANLPLSFPGRRLTCFSFVFQGQRQRGNSAETVQECPTPTGRAARRRKAEPHRVAPAQTVRRRGAIERGETPQPGSSPASNRA